MLLEFLKFYETYVRYIVPILAKFTSKLTPKPTETRFDAAFSPALWALFSARAWPQAESIGWLIKRKEKEWPPRKKTFLR